VIGLHASAMVFMGSFKLYPCWQQQQHDDGDCDCDGDGDGDGDDNSAVVPSGPERVLLRLTMDQKCEIAHRECEELRAEITRYAETGEKIQDGHRASVEESEVHLDEIRKSR
jgi:hypothetical protein